MTNAVRQAIFLNKICTDNKIQLAQVGFIFTYDFRENREIFFASFQFALCMLKQVRLK